ncbi:MAG: 2-amino-4-hydroxy-6-hydroxymethyldihydropteridine diphosphokinase [Gammaproteobacteria bacterium]|nr:2-amino-4-hydroxy-6-hydroxymethyldihydropteridine diphosphokinase [Gammaproteobacteria bacterium]
MTRTRCYIGLGSNLDDPESQIRRACEAIKQLPETTLLRSSPLYRNPPMGPANQPEFINCAVEAESALSPLKLLHQLLQIERNQGRIRGGDGATHWGPRQIDLDLLIYGHEQINSDELTLPHPGIHLRNFVLQPLFDLNPGLLIPGQGPVQLLLQSCNDHELIRL